MSTARNTWYWPLLGAFGGVFFGIMDAAIDVTFFYSDETFFETLFFPSALEIWLRSLVLLLMISFGLYVRYSMRRLVLVRLKLEHKEELLKKELVAKEELANRDPLTGIYNRRKFFSFLEEHMDESRRYHFPLTVLMLDLDFFKKVNDVYGHNEGDKVLFKFCKLVSGQIRKSDLFARVGGEEFAIATVHTSAKQAAVIAEKVRKSVEKKLKTRDGVVTVSVGVAQFQDEDTVDDLLHRADQSLYKAKSAGRNCVGPAFGNEEGSVTF